MKMCCALYRGSLAFRNRASANKNFIPFGNAEFTLNQEEAEVTQENFESLGGSACKVVYINSVTLDITAHCLKAENIAMAVLGTLSVLTPDTVTDEEHTVHGVDVIIPFENVPDKAQAITVKDEAGTTTYVLGEDYILTNSGIKIIEGTSIAVDGSVIKVGYTYGANVVIDALTMGQQEFEVIFDGVNVGEAGETPVVIRFPKVKVSPAAALPLIAGQEFTSLEMTGEVLRDETITTGSKFYKLTYGEAAGGTY